MLNVKAILDAFLTATTDQSAAMRSRALAWLNMGMKRIAAEPRDWHFLTAAATLPIVNGAVTLPADCKKVIYIEAADKGWFLTDKDRLSPQEIARQGQTFSSRPKGFAASGNTLTFVPAGIADTSCNILYQRTVPDYVDAAVDTIFPDEFAMFFQRMLLAMWYEFDFDERLPMALQAQAAEFRSMKAWDNSLKPIPAYFTAESVKNYAP